MSTITSPKTAVHIGSRSIGSVIIRKFGLCISWLASLSGNLVEKVKFRHVSPGKKNRFTSADNWKFFYKYLIIGNFVAANGLS